MPSIEKRKYSRIPVSVAISFSAVDKKGAPINFYMGMVKDVSQSGLALEVFCEMESRLILLSFFDVAGKKLEIYGKAVYARQSAPGKMMVGVSLLGKPDENIGFVKELVRFHHYTKKISGAGSC